MTQDIFEFWSPMPKGEKIHPADKEVLQRIDPKRHGFRLECLPGSFSGPLKTARVVLLHLSPGFSKADIREANDEEVHEYYFQKWKGELPHRDGPNMPGTKWLKSRTKVFGEWEDVRRKVAIFNLGAYHSKNVKDYSVFAALPSSRASLDWAQRVLFREAEAGKRIVICMRSAAYWGLEQGKKYSGKLFVPAVTRSGHLRRNPSNERLARLVRSEISGDPICTRPSSASELSTAELLAHMLSTSSQTTGCEASQQEAPYRGAIAASRRSVLVYETTAWDLYGISRSSAVSPAPESHSPDEDSGGARSGRLHH